MPKENDKEASKKFDICFIITYINF